MPDDFLPWAVVQDPAGSADMRFGTGGVCDNQPQMYPQAAPVPGPESAWYVTQWHKAEYLDPASVQGAGAVAEAPGLGAPVESWTTPDGLTGLQVYQAADGGDVFHLQSEDGARTAAGGANLFLQTDIAPGVTFADTLIYSVAVDVSVASVSYTVPVAQKTRDVLAQAFTGFVIGCNIPGSAGYDPQAPSMTGFMQIGLADSGGAGIPTYAGGCVDGSGNATLVATMTLPGDAVLPFAPGGAGPRPVAYDLNAYFQAFVAQGFAVTTANGGQATLRLSGAEADPANWSLEGMYIGVETQDTGLDDTVPLGSVAIGLDVGHLGLTALPAGLGAVSGAVMSTDAGGQFVLPESCGVFESDAWQGVTVFGGARDGVVVLSGRGGLAFEAGTGASSVHAEGGDNLASAYAGAGDMFAALGDGDDTVLALGGDDTVLGGTGCNEILTGAGDDVVESHGTDLIAAGAVGHATITSGTNDPTVFLGPGTSLFEGGGGAATVVGGSGTDTLNSAGGATLWLGQGRDVVNTTGADTIIGGAGAATVNASGDSLLFAGGGSMRFVENGGAQTILGSAAGTLAMQGGAGSVLALSYGDATFIGGGGAATVAGFAGALSVCGGTGSGVYEGGPAGGNRITGGPGQATILGGGAGDVLCAGSGAGDVIAAGPGAETISAAGTSGAETLYGGSGPDVIATGLGAADVLLGSGATTLIAGGGMDLYALTRGNANAVVVENFSATTDYFSLVGFGPGAAAGALAAAVTGAGGEEVPLPDGTRILLAGFSGLTADRFI